MLTILNAGYMSASGLAHQPSGHWNHSPIQQHTTLYFFPNLHHLLIAIPRLQSTIKLTSAFRTPNLRLDQLCGTP